MDHAQRRDAFQEVEVKEDLREIRVQLDVVDGLEAVLFKFFHHPA